MVRQRGYLSIAQARVLRVLSCGGMLTERQIAASAGLGAWRVRQAVSSLFERDFIVTGARRGRYEITRLGRDALAAGGSGHGRLDA
ncbi:hypothetical protein [Nocardia vaccinii]|uniref:hypothetical protein n=1 Tax=Nocardia vaccinii TaxID=1822 RepID=UPI0012F50D32|nr:hypothetical protein [Nocardia vaccinii]